MLRRCFCIPPMLPVSAFTFYMFSFCIWVLPGAHFPISLVGETYTELLLFFLLIQIIKQLSEDLSKRTSCHFFPRRKNIPLAAGGILRASTLSATWGAGFPEADLSNFYIIVSVCEISLFGVWDSILYSWVSQLIFINHRKLCGSSFEM